MKNKIIILSILAFTLTSCSSYFDDPPTYAIGLGNASSKDYYASYIGIHNAIQTNWELFWLTEDNSADNLIYRTSFWQHGEINDNRITLNNTFMNNDWGYIYRGIFACNTFLSLLNKESDKTQVVNGISINQYIADARAIRAYIYYKGITLWGDMPYVNENTTTEEAKVIARTPVATIITNMIGDLKFAQENGRPYSVTGPKYMSKEAATALLARLYLYNDDLPNAKIEAEKVIASTTVGITNNYLGIWRGTNNKEIIFYMTGSATDQNSHGYYLRAESNNGRFELPVDPTLVADFALEPADARVAVITASGVAAYPRQCIKYNNADNVDIWPIVRVAEMYLISAEANGYPAGLTRLNQIRAQRGLPALTTATVTNPTRFAQAVMRERRLELCFEGHRFTDLKRMCKKYNLNITQYLPNITGINDNNLWYAVPQEQIQVNPNLTQNPGY